MNSVTTVSFTGDYRVDTLAQHLLEWSVRIREQAKKAEDAQKTAMYYRWLSGKEYTENESYVLQVCGSQKAFAELIGITEQVLSNNKNGYKRLLEAGCTTWEEVLEFLKSKEIAPTTYNFERMGKLLNAPDADTKPKKQRSKDEKRLLELIEEAEQIKQRNETANHNVFQLAESAVNQLKDLNEHLGKLDPFRSDWRSEKYLNFIRSFGWDVIMDVPCDNPDPHHVIPSQKQRVGKKVSDVFTIPVSRETHEMLENGTWVLSEDEIKDALIRVMSIAIMNLIK